MNGIKLKPQWLFRMIEGAPYLTNEHNHYAQSTEHTALLSKLAFGVDSDTLTDEEFQALESLNAGGFLTTLPISNNEIGQFVWELGGVPQKTVADQFAHCTFKTLAMGEHKEAALRLDKSLAAGGMVWSADAPRLVIVLVDSYQELPVAENARCVLPVVLGRTRCSIGPLTFPWRQAIRDQVMLNESYLPHVNYKLPPPLVDLQLAWTGAMILRFVVSMTTPLVNNIIEYDMVNQLQHKWAVS